MIDENEDYVVKSKLTITVKTFTKYNDKNRVAAKQTNKQIQRHRKQQNMRQKNKKTYLKIDTEADIQWTNAKREVNKKWQMRPYVLLLLK